MTTPTNNSLEVVAIASGKGGVGKTLLAACLATIANEDERYNGKTLLVDMDFGVKGLTFLIGAAEFWKDHSGTMLDVLSGRSPSVVLENAKNIHGIRIIPSDTNFGQQINWDEYFPEYARSEEAIQDFLKKATDKGFNFIVFDTGAGIDRTIVSLARYAKKILVVVEPDEISRTAALDLHGELSGINDNLYFVLNKMPEAEDAVAMQSGAIRYVSALPFDHRMHVRFVRNARSLWSQQFRRMRYKRYVGRIAGELFGIDVIRPGIWDLVSEKTATKVVFRFFGYGVVFLVFLSVVLAIIAGSM